MIEFSLYQITLKKSSDTDWTVSEDCPLENAQERFGMLFRSKCELKLLMKDSNDESVKLHNVVLASHDNIIVWRIHNETEKEIVKPKGTITNGIPDYESVRESSYPHSLVIIDNRPGKLLLAIEKSTAWRSSTNKVKDILQDNLSQQLKSQQNIDIDIDIRELTLPSKIWDFCEQQCKDGRDYIKNISINIKNPKETLPNRDGNQESFPALLRAAEEYMTITKAVETVIGMNYRNGIPEQMKNNMDDIVQIVRTCTQKTYSLAVTFEKYGVYKCDETVIAQFSLQDGYISNFVQELPDLDYKYSLEKWLDDVDNKLDEFKNVSEIPKGRNR